MTNEEERELVSKHFTETVKIAPTLWKGMQPRGGIQPMVHVIERDGGVNVLGFGADIMENWKGDGGDQALAVVKKHIDDHDSVGIIFISEATMRPPGVPREFGEDILFARGEGRGQSMLAKWEVIMGDDGKPLRLGDVVVSDGQTDEGRWTHLFDEHN